MDWNRCEGKRKDRIFDPRNISRPERGWFAMRWSMITAVDLASSERPYCDPRLLLREFTHRINNEFASAIGVIAVAAARSRNHEVKAALAAVEQHLESCAQMHHALQMPEHGTCIDAAVYLRQVCCAISRAMLDHRAIELLIVERSFRMESERCWRLALIVSELITNAARHAFDRGPRPRLIKVELQPSAAFAKCRISDNGSSDTNIAAGCGLRIVDGLAKSLGGTIHHRFGPRGGRSVLIFPIGHERTENKWLAGSKSHHLASAALSSLDSPPYQRGRHGRDAACSSV
jgi:two-component sensor histidine kinase